MLKSIEREILNAHKYKNIKKFGSFKAQISLECYCLACEAEARHIYCFPGGGVVVGGGGSVNFFAFRSFSRKL